MLRASKTWDIRCPQALADLFPVRKGYYFKITRDQARAVCNVLSKVYGISEPTITNTMPQKGSNGDCSYRYRKDKNGFQQKHSVIRIHPRGHIKTTIHEWYHHLDWMTNGQYNSSDAKQYAWDFAERMFDVFRVTKAK